jgi:hypothetical protein
MEPAPWMIGYSFVAMFAFVATGASGRHDVWEGAAIGILWPVYFAVKIAKAARRVFTS